MLTQKTFELSLYLGYEMAMNVIKTLLTVMVLPFLILITGCSEISDLMQPSSPAGPDIVRRAKLGENWQMDQMRVHIGAGDESVVLLKLSAGDKVDGYFYIEKGEDVDFQITGNSLVYEPDKEGAAIITSERFSFVATRSQGNTYTFTFRNPTDDDEIVFVEVIYPIDGSLFFTIEK